MKFVQVMEVRTKRSVLCIVYCEQQHAEESLFGHPTPQKAVPYNPFSSHSLPLRIQNRRRIGQKITNSSAIVEVHGRPVDDMRSEMIQSIIHVSKSTLPKKKHAKLRKPTQRVLICPIVAATVSVPYPPNLCGVSIGRFRWTGHLSMFSASRFWELRIKNSQTSSWKPFGDAFAVVLSCHVI